MDVEGKVMSLRFTGSRAATPRVAIAAAFAATLGLTTLAAADQNVTALLRNGERVTGLFDGFNNGQVYVDVSASDERKIPVGDVVLLDFVGGAQGLPETELSQARGDDHVLLLKSGSASTGRLVTIEGTDRNPTVIFRTSSGEERRVKTSEVGRLYLGRYPGATPAASPATSTANPTATTATAQSGAVTVPGNQQWVTTNITVARGQQVRFASSGQIQLSGDANDVATLGGSKQGRRMTGGPLPGALAGALIGRVGNGNPFGIGDQAGPLTMPDAGVLYLGVNDDNVADNGGAFNVTVTAVPVTSRPGRNHNPSSR
jgi:hypothetical protein